MISEVLTAAQKAFDEHFADDMYGGKNYMTSNIEEQENVPDRLFCRFKSLDDHGLRWIQSYCFVNELYLCFIGATNGFFDVKMMES